MTKVLHSFIFSADSAFPISHQCLIGLQLRVETRIFVKDALLCRLACFGDLTVSDFFSAFYGKLNSSSHSLLVQQNFNPLSLPATMNYKPWTYGSHGANIQIHCWSFRQLIGSFFNAQENSQSQEIYGALGWSKSGVLTVEEAVALVPIERHPKKDIRNSRFDKG